MALLLLKGSGFGATQASLLTPRTNERRSRNTLYGRTHGPHGPSVRYVSDMLLRGYRTLGSGTTATTVVSLPMAVGAAFTDDPDTKTSAPTKEEECVQGKH